MTDKIQTGSKILDKVLDGGYETDIVTTIYGPSGSAKTTLCILAAVTVARKGKKVIYIDTEGGFSVERMSQICNSMRLDLNKILSNITFLKPTTFDEQKKQFEKLKEIITDRVGLVVVDTIAMLYRLAIGGSNNIKDVNRELGKQISFLSEIARKKNIPVILTNQVYADFEQKDKINMVGGDIIRYQSKCLLELQITEENNRKFIVIKHRSIPENRKFIFKIVNGGIIGTREKQKRFLFR